MVSQLSLLLDRGSVVAVWLLGSGVASAVEPLEVGAGSAATFSATCFVFLLFGGIEQVFIFILFNLQGDLEFVGDSSTSSCHSNHGVTLEGSFG